MKEWTGHGQKQLLSFLKQACTPHLPGGLARVWEILKLSTSRRENSGEFDSSRCEVRGSVMGIYWSFFILVV
jgi:hypothetical protein